MSYAAEDFTLDEHIDIRESPRVWFDMFGWVEDREKKLRKADPANNIQGQIFDAYEWCQANGVPCNIIGLKSRKEGLSTGASALAYHHLQEHKSEGVVIGTDHETSDTLMRMLVRYAEKDAYPWGQKFAFRPAENRGLWSHGSVVKRDTAIDPKAGRSSTVQVLIATEVAHWPAAGVRSADETMLSILNSMPDIPNLLRVVDSTANGAAGWFYQTYQGAVTFAERRAGKLGNGWIKIFEPWHASPLRQMPVTSEERVEIPESSTPRERAGVIEFGWTVEQIKWRRETIATKCGGNETKFDQEYPESEAVAFATSGSIRFDREGLANLRVMANEGHTKGVIGVLEEHEGKVTFRREEHGWLWRSEAPTFDRSYLVSCDPNTCEQAAGTTDRDNTACCVLREAYRLDGVEYDTEVAACLHDERDPQNPGVKWDSDALADRMTLLVKYYGNCLAAVEANNFGSALMKELASRGVTLYRRTKPDDINPSKTLRIVGYLSSGKTREWWVQKLAEYIREKRIKCRYLPAVREFETFVTKESGRSEALDGKHDDWVACIGIGLEVNQFTRMVEPELPNWRREPAAAGPWS